MARKKVAEQVLYYLYRINFVDKQTAVGVIYLYCVGGKIFSVFTKHKCESGELLLAKYEKGLLTALYKARKTEKRVYTEKLFRGSGNLKYLSISKISDWS